MPTPLRNPLALLAFSALALIGAVVLLLEHQQVPPWLVAAIGAGVYGGAAVMTPGLSTVERLLLPQLQAQNVQPPAAAPVSPVQALTPPPAPVTFTDPDGDVVGDPAPPAPAPVSFPAAAGAAVVTTQLGSG